MLSWRLRAPTAQQASRGFAFAAPIGLLLYYALREGSYDSVVWLAEAIALWLVVAAGFALGVLPRAAWRRSMLLPLAAVGLLAAWTALGLTWTESAERTFLEIGRLAHFAAILVAAWALLGPRTRTPAACGIAVGGALVCILAVVSRLFPAALPADAAAEAGLLSRLSYPLDYWNALAAWAAMSLAMLVALSAHARRLWIRAALLALTHWCGYALYLTYSRAGLVSALLAVVVAVALSRNRWVAAAHAAAAAAASAAAAATIRSYPTVVELTGGRVLLVLVAVLAAGSLACAGVAAATWRVGGDERWRLAPRTARSAVALGALVLIVAVATLGSGAVSSAWDQFRGAGGAAPTTTPSHPAKRLASTESNRYAYWTAALDAFGTAPSTGIGPGVFEFWWNRTGNGEIVRDAHSLYLEHLAEAGWPGLVLVGAFVLSLVGLGLRARLRWPEWASTEGRNGGIGVGAATGSVVLVYAIYASIDWLWESTAVSALALICAAVAYSPTEERTGPVPVPVRAAVPLAAVAIALFVLLPPLAATTSFRDSQAAYRAGDIAASEEAAADAVDAEPWAASPRVQQALLAEVRDRLPEARASTLEAIDREPTNWTHRVLLARIEGALGDREAAEEAFAEALRLGPPKAELLKEPPF